MIHFSALEGCSDFEGREIVRARAIEDLQVLQAQGIDAVLFENNFDTPKQARLPERAAQHFRELVAELAPITHVPWGICALWNDYDLGFELCSKYGGQAVRIPVFTDSVDTTYGRFLADPSAVITSREHHQAEEVLILADVQVKHAQLVAPRSFAESFEDTIQLGADGAIITGQWTGDPPSVEQCRAAQLQNQNRVHLLTGSGMTTDNISSFLPFLDGCIVGSAFKEGSLDLQHRQGPNIVEPARRYDPVKIRRFLDTVKKAENKDFPRAS